MSYFFRSTAGARVKPYIVFAVAGIAALALWAPSAWATGFYPTRTDDPPPNGCSSGDCSLREAVIAADANPGFDFIQLAGDRYVLSRATPSGQPDTPADGDLDVTQPNNADLFVLGRGSGQTAIDGGGIDRIFDIAANARLLIYLVMIRNGDARPGFVGHAHGGGIHNHGYLGLFWSAVTGNTAGRTPGTSWGGGGITNAGSGTIDVEDVTVARNATASCGGGIENGGTMRLTDVTVSDNRAPRSKGPGVSNGTGSTGCFFNAGTVQLTNSIVARNTDENCAGAITSGGHNLGSDTSCGSDPVKQDIVAAFPRLNPLFDADGFLWMYQLRPGSPAIDAGSPAFTSTAPGCAPYDQVLTRRPQDGDGDGLSVCDIGAYERPAGLATRRLLSRRGDRLVSAAWLQRLRSALARDAAQLHGRRPLRP
jgi:hypothetical protein